MNIAESMNFQANPTDSTNYHWSWAIGVKSDMICFWSVKLSDDPESINQSNDVIDLKVSEAANASLWPYLL